MGISVRKKVHCITSVCHHPAIKRYLPGRMGFVVHGSGCIPDAVNANRQGHAATICVLNLLRSYEILNGAMPTARWHLISAGVACCSARHPGSCIEASSGRVPLYIRPRQPTGCPGSFETCQIEMLCGASQTLLFHIACTQAGHRRIGCCRHLTVL